MSRWNFDSIPSQSGRTAIVTGANTGIGFETARALARKGARVILACRNLEKGREAVSRVHRETPLARVEAQPLDLSDLASVRAFARAFSGAHQRLDLLVNNAGVMIPPFSRTKEGFELQFGTNHLGHFALTGFLMPLLRVTSSSRVVVVYSSAHRAGRIDFDDPNYDRRPYRAWQAYSQSKLANVLFALELDRRLQAARTSPTVTSAHPGWTATDLQRTAGVVRFLNPLFAMDAGDGALPTLRAATDPQALAGSYWGPSRFFELNGPPGPGRITAAGQDRTVAARLWDLSEELTGVRYDVTGAVAV
jgi:NAD(P)-dependent dehydrogenase (short-subunit alcohol dehydrogenase family)